MGRTIAGQNGTSTGQKNFGRVDPFVLFAVLPMLVAAGYFLWSGIAPVGIGLIVLVGLIVLFDSWANRPIKKAARDRDDY